MKLWRKIAMKNGKGKGDSIRRIMRENKGMKVTVTEDGAMRFGGNGVPTLLESMFKRAGIVKAKEAESITEVLQETSEVQDVEAKEVTA